MKISKHTHSCLLIEEDNRTVLIDPGNYTDEENALNLNDLVGLDYLLITHQHPDHMYLPMVKEILQKFPAVKILSNLSVAQILSKEGIKVQTKGDNFINIGSAIHEYVFGDVTMPQNSIFTIAGKLTHPGDSFSFNRTTDILALPICAPWGSTTQAVELAIKLKPKIVIPIHDWQWNDKARQNMYKRLEDFFKEIGIEFKTEIT